jgi:DmsE family decaheme c-type cytochrome
MRASGAPSGGGCCRLGCSANTALGEERKCAALIFVLMLSGIFIALLDYPARAEMLQAPDAVYAALRDYAESINGEEMPPIVASSSSARGAAPNDEIHAALRNSPLALLDHPARAEMLKLPDADYAALRDYVQSINAEETLPVVANGFSTPSAAPDDEIHAALRNLHRTTELDDTASVPLAPFAVAQATNAFDALREFMKGKDGEQTPPPPAPSKAAPPPKIAPPKAAGTFKAVAVNATYVGSKVCATCHVVHVENFSVTLMGRLFKQGKLQCETCHGPGSAHAKAGGGRGVGGIISFRADDAARTPEENNAICLRCHERGARTYWTGSTHETQRVACTDCHTIMRAVSRNKQLKTAFQPDTCFQCHKDRRAQMFRSAHMPMREGKVVCTDCHNPHGSFTEALLKEDSVNDTCYKCHAEKRGPFLFEHEPVRQNCLTCHNAHGSVKNEYSLLMSRPRLCFECHGTGHTGQGSGPFSQYTMGRACQNCHTEVHGSNSPAGVLLHR